MPPARSCGSWSRTKTPVDGGPAAADRDRLTHGHFDKLLIANRGEIAVRIMRAARELGIAPLQVHSAADRDSLAVRHGRRGGGHRSRRPRPSAISTARRSSMRRGETGADAMHPGYGFLSENAGFADAVEAAGLVFVGPSGETIRAHGRQGGGAPAPRWRPACPSCPARDGRVADPAEARAAARGRSATR